uniref:Selenoprotein P N-terminal domain-containing protein n=1 Tax=Setaria digitata TaxID=48799 RepID=A0A915Q6R2_9BILA
MQKMSYCSVICFDTLLLLLSIAMFAKPVVKSAPLLCNQTKSWKLGGRDIVADSKGFVLLVVLMPMQCEHCHQQLMKFQTIMETLSEIRIVVVAPHDENPRLIEHYRREFPRVAIGVESVAEPVWNTLSGSAHDHFIYDRCGRLARVIRHPKSDTTKFEHTLLALKLAVSYAQCGWCQYDPPDLPAPQKPVMTTVRNGKMKKTRIKAVVHPLIGRTPAMGWSYRSNTVAPVLEVQSRSPGTHLPSLASAAPSSTAIETMVNSNEPQQPLSVQENDQISQMRSKFGSDQRRIGNRPDKDVSRANDWRVSDGLTSSRIFLSGIRHDRVQQREQHQQQREKQKDRQHHRGRKQQEQEYIQNLEQLRINQEQEKRIREQQEEERRIRKQQEEERRIWEQRRLQEMQQQQHQEREQQRLQQQELQRRIEEQRRLQEQIESELYAGVSGEQDEGESAQENENNWGQLRAPLHHRDYTSTMKTSFAPITRSTKTPSLYDSGDEDDYDYSQMASETTVAPTERTQISGTMPSGHWPTPFVFEEQVPCAAFTDEVCIEQKRRMGSDKMSKCCDKGIYLTDLCMPGRCTNATTELCCMQKFLQSKYSCCRNDSEAINSPGDAFSRCCFHKFVQDDDRCCPAHRAKFHWLSAHEICLPNVRVDLSGLRFVVHVDGKGQHLDGRNSNQAFNEAITIDLNVDKSWDHSCEQGAKVLQFPYLPSNREEQEGDENSEESR